MPSHIITPEWDSIVETIKNQQCVLFLGPLATVNATDPERQSQFFRKFYAENENQIAAFHERDGLLIFKSKMARNKFIARFKSFYEQDFNNQVLEMISEIPFHLIISATPDVSLKKTFDKLKFDYHFNFYDKRRERKIENPPTAKQPLLYNLLGSIDEWDTLIISHADVFDYIRQSYVSTYLNGLKSLLSADKSPYLIFLGFEFDKWYYQLLLNLLELDSDEFVRYASIKESMDNDGELLTLFENHFHMEFVTHNIPEFVTHLHGEFSKRGLLRKPLEDTEKPRDFNLASITKLLMATFDGSQLEIFCMCNYTDVYEEFSPEQGKTKRISLLLDHVRRNQSFQELLNLVKDENPVQFENFKPYF